MNISPLDSRFSVWVVESLGHVLWQGCALTALAMLIGHALRNRTASARYICYCVALLLTTLTLPINLVYHAEDLADSDDVVSSTKLADDTNPTQQQLALQNPTPGELETQSRLNSSPFGTAPTDTEVFEQWSSDESAATGSLAGTQRSSVTTPQPVAAALTNPSSPSWQRWSVWIVAGYVVGMLAMTLRLACGIYGSGRLKSGIRTSQHPHVHRVLFLAKQLDR